MAYYLLPGGLPMKTPPGSTLVMADGVTELNEQDYLVLLAEWNKNSIIRLDLARIQGAQENTALSTLREAAMNKLMAGNPLSAEEAQAVIPKLYTPG